MLRCTSVEQTYRTEIYLSTRSESREIPCKTLALRESESIMSLCELESNAKNAKETPVFSGIEEIQTTALPKENHADSLLDHKGSSGAFSGTLTATSETYCCCV